MPTEPAAGAKPRIKIFADGADVAQIRKAAADPRISGFTTNPTLMRKAGVDDYEAFAEALEAVPDLPISFEVLSDDAEGMVRQARAIAGWGDNVYVKVPVTFTDGSPTSAVLRELVADGVQLNVTALLAVDQVSAVVADLAGSRASYVSVFAGRIADTGRDPVPPMAESLAIVHTCAACELIWASPREVLNVVQAAAIGCDIITVTNDLLAKLDGLGRDVLDVSLDTVKMFRDDVVRAGYTL